MKKIKILCILNSLDKCNGIATYIMNYYKKINHNLIRYDFLITDNNINENYKNEIESNGDNIIIISRVKIKSIFSDCKKIDDFFKNNNDYDIVYSHILYTAYFYFKYAKKYKIKNLILHSHNTPSKTSNNLKELLYKLMSKLAVKSCNICFACSDYAGKYLFKEKSFYVINNAIETQKYIFNQEIRDGYRKKMNLSEDTLVIGHVGRFDVQKNHKYIIDVFEKVLQKKANSKLMLIGNGVMEEEIQNYSKSKGINDKILYLGLREDVQNLLQSMDIFILPSLFEGLPLVAIEAQCSDLKCILSNNITRETSITDRVEYIDIKKENIDEWCNMIINNNKYIRKNNENVLVKMGYDIDTEVKKLEQLFVNIVENGDKNDNT